MRICFGYCKTALIHDNSMLAERAFYFLSQECQKAVRKKIASIRTAFYTNDTRCENV